MGFPAAQARRRRAGVVGVRLLGFSLGLLLLLDPGWAFRPGVVPRSRHPLAAAPQASAKRYVSDHYT
jgi:hypothetical protein